MFEVTHESSKLFGKRLVFSDLGVLCFVITCSGFEAHLQSQCLPCVVPCFIPFLWGSLKAYPHTALKWSTLRGGEPPVPYQVTTQGPTHRHITRLLRGSASLYLSLSIYLYLLFISIYLYLSLSISIHLYPSPSLSVSIYLYLYLSLSISIYLDLSLSISIYL